MRSRSEAFSPGCSVSAAPERRIQNSAFFRWSNLSQSVTLRSYSSCTVHKTYKKGYVLWTALFGRLKKTFHICFLLSRVGARWARDCFPTYRVLRWLRDRLRRSDGQWLDRQRPASRKYYQQQIRAAPHRWRGGDSRPAHL